jgi:hypothetical protein
MVKIINIPIENETNIFKRFKIRPFVEVDSANETLLKKINFEITTFSAYSNKEGWIAVHLDWKSNWKNNDWRFKYPEDGGRGACIGHDEYVVLSFNQVRYRKRYGSGCRFTSSFKLEVGLGFDLEDDEDVSNDIGFPFRFKFFENTKYGGVVWFAPENWGRDCKKEYAIDIVKDVATYS